MFKNPRYTNDEGGIVVDYEDDSGSVYLDPGNALHAEVASGAYGVVASYEPDPEPEPTPEELRERMLPLTARQLRLGLIANGITLASVQTIIDGIADPVERETALVEWEYATTFVRLHPLIVQVAAALSLTPEQVDTMWEAALAL